MFRCSFTLTNPGVASSFKLDACQFFVQSVFRPKKSSQVRNYISHKKDPCSGVILSWDKVGHSLNWMEYLPLNFNTSLVVADWNGRKYHPELISVFVVMLYKPWQSRPKTTILYLKRKTTILCFSCYNLDLMGFLLQERWSSVWWNRRCLPSWLRRASWFCCWYSPESSEVCKDSSLTVSLYVALFTLFDVNRVVNLRFIRMWFFLILCTVAGHSQCL